MSCFGLNLEVFFKSIGIVFRGFIWFCIFRRVIFGLGYRFIFCLISFFIIIGF